MTSNITFPCQYLCIRVFVCGVFLYTYSFVFVCALSLCVCVFCTLEVMWVGVRFCQFVYTSTSHRMLHVSGLVLLGILSSLFCHVLSLLLVPTSCPQHPPLACWHNRLWALFRWNGGGVHVLQLFMLTGTNSRQTMNQPRNARLILRMMIIF